MDGFRTSRYNFAVYAGGDTLLFNARSGALLRLLGPDATHVAAAMTQFRSAAATGAFPEALTSLLLAGEFLIPHDRDELAEIRAAFWRAREATPFVLTLTTTMDCNLACHYCYETRTTDTLGEADLDALLDLARAGLTRTARRALHVDWYGGEPLLNVAFMDRAAAALQALCAELGCTYHASVISNGTVWPEDVGGFLSHHRIRQVQITLDGLPSTHNRRRRFRSKTSAGDSFALATSVIDRLLGHVRVDLRLNIDDHNQNDVLPLIALARDRGWFSRPHPLVIQPARVAAYSDRVAFLGPRTLSFDRFDVLKQQIRDADLSQIEESEMPDGQARPKSSVCAALATDSVVIGAEGLLYRCGLQVGQRSRAIGALQTPSRVHENLDTWPDRPFWADFDPTTIDSCSKCSFLPLCWGGCPKQHLERDDWALFQQSLFWRQRLPALIAATAGVAATALVPFGPELQFRDDDELRARTVVTRALKGTGRVLPLQLV